MAPYRPPTVEDEHELEAEENVVQSSSVQPAGTLSSSRYAETAPPEVDDYTPSPFAQARHGLEVPLPENSTIDNWLLSTLQNSRRLTPYVFRNILHEHRLATCGRGAGRSENRHYSGLDTSPQGPLPFQSGTHRREVLSSMRRKYTAIDAPIFRDSRMGNGEDIELLDDSPEANDAAFAVLRATREQSRLTRKPPRQGLIIPDIISINTQRATPPASSPAIPPRPDSFDEFYDLTPEYQRRFRRDPDRSEPDPRPLAGRAPVRRVLVRPVRRPVPEMRRIVRGGHTSRQPPPGLSSTDGRLEPERLPQRIQPSEDPEDVSRGEKDNAAIATLGPIEVGLAVVKSAAQAGGNLALFSFVVMSFAIAFYVVTTAVFRLAIRAVILPSGW